MATPKGHIARGRNACPDAMRTTVIRQLMAMLDQFGQR